MRADASRALIIDFSNVPYVDSAGIGALVGAYVTRQKGGRTLALVGVCKRIHDALGVTRVEQFFRFFDSVNAAEQASSSKVPGGQCSVTSKIEWLLLDYRPLITDHCSSV